MTGTTTGGCGCGCGGGTGCSCGACACETLTTFERPRFFSGQLLTEAELNGEQAYVVAKQRLHNRFLHGHGVVCGLRVSCCDATHVTVEAGYALDPCGNDVVLAEGATVDLVRLVRDCRNRTRRAAECDPFLDARLTGCEGVDQTWCLTIAYAERDARPVAALRSSATAPAHAAVTPGCGCSGNGNGNGNGAAAAVDAIGRSATACEPTRVVEAVTFGVACLPDEPARREGDRELAERAPAGTLLGEVLRCQADFALVLDDRPDLGDEQPQEAYTVVCRWFAQVKAALAAHPTTRCGAARAVAGIAVPAPPQDEQADPAAYRAQLQAIVEELAAAVRAAAMECVCWNLLPGCPPCPPDDRVVLACVTLRDDQIVDICHGWPRRQVVSFPSLEYWLAGLGQEKSGWAGQLPTLLSPDALGRAVSLLCCGEHRGRIPSKAEATRLYALGDLSGRRAPTEAASGLPPSEFQRLRAGVASLRERAVDALRSRR